MKPKPLPEKFSKHSHTYEQIERTEKAAIYAIDGRFYDVFIIRISKRYNSEQYPTVKQFGITAWCKLDYNEAMQIFNEIK